MEPRLFCDTRKTHSVFLSVVLKSLALSIAYFMDITPPQLPCRAQKGLWIFSSLEH